LHIVTQVTSRRDVGTANPSREPHDYISAPVDCEKQPKRRGLIQNDSGNSRWKEGGSLNACEGGERTATGIGRSLSVACPLPAPFIEPCRAALIRRCPRGLDDVAVACSEQLPKNGPSGS